MSAPGRLPDVNRVGYGAPLRWLGGGWADLWKAPGPCLVYGAFIAALLSLVTYALYASGLAFQVVILTLGLVLIAPILAMGPYEAGRRLEAGQRPRLAQIFVVRSALRQDAFFLGLAMFLVFSFWIQAAQIVYGLSTYQLHATLPEFLDFAFKTEDGRRMLAIGGVIGGAIAFVAYTLVVVSAPMLLERRFDVFMATVTSVRVVTQNPGPMLLWAAIVASLVLASAATGFLALVVVFPWLGLASWRAYRGLVAVEPAVQP
jgi:uncharacterized membrane protein